jgi:hypothetical protein
MFVREKKFRYSHNHEHQGEHDRGMEDDQDSTCKVVSRDEWRHLIKFGANAGNLSPLRRCATSTDNAVDWG